MLSDLATWYYDRSNGCNYSCSESMIHAIDEYYEMHLPQEVFLAASAFSGGCGHDELCGAVASALAALSILYSAEGHAHSSEILLEARKKLLAEFEQQFGPYRCAELKKRYSIPEKRCQVLVAACADILERIIDEYEIVNPKLKQIRKQKG